MGDFAALKKALEVPDDLEFLLARLTSPEESKMLAETADGFKTAKTIAEKLGQSIENVASKLESLYQRGFLYKKEVGKQKAYRCKNFLDIVRTHLEEHRYEELGFENIHMLRQYYISNRIERNEKNIESGQLQYTSRVIPIGKALSATQQVLPTQQAIEILKEADCFALTKCGCRVAFENCDKPVETCLVLNDEAEYLLSRGQAKKMALTKAKEILGIADKAGLVHLALYMPGQKPYGICSCCPCCCHDLQALLKYGKTTFVAKSDYIVEIEKELCNGCGVCVKRCVFGARKLAGGKSLLKQDGCYGCGLCVTTCPTKASTLVYRG